ncbi:cyclic nucleotide-gated ion channel 1, partial [Quercus suber]
MDPLFFYLPVINEDKKCIELDERLWTRALFRRSFNDMIYLMHIILQFRTGFIDKKLHKLGRPALITDSWKIARRYLWPYFLLDLLVILPIPQNSPNRPISWKKLIRSNEKFEKTIWFKAALNFFLYLLAGH